MVKEMSGSLISKGGIILIALGALMIVMSVHNSYASGKLVSENIIPGVDNNLLLVIVLLILATVVAMILLKRGDKHKKEVEEVVPRRPQFSFEEASINSQPLNRCPNPNCRAFFSEPRTVTDYMVKKGEPPMVFNVCPKCGAYIGLVVPKVVSKPSSVVPSVPSPLEPPVISPEVARIEPEPIPLIEYRYFLTVNPIRIKKIVSALIEYKVGNIKTTIEDGEQLIVFDYPKELTFDMMVKKGWLKKWRKQLLE